MSKKLIIVFAVIATFIGCSFSSSEVQTNLQLEGKNIFLSFLMWSLWDRKKTDYMNQIILIAFNWFVKKLYFSETRNETTSDLPKPHIVIIGATGSLNLSNGHSPANLANSSTRQKFAKFLWLAPANLASIEQIFVTRSGKFGEYWVNLANLANLASLANLARID